MGASALGALLAAVPAAFRIASSAAASSGTHAAGLGDIAKTWTMLGALGAVPMGLAILVLRRARAAFFALDGRPTLALTGLLWFVSSFGSLAFLGSLLRARTHHRALGGVVFALCALFLMAFLAPVSARAAKILFRFAGPVFGGTRACGAALLALVFAAAIAGLVDGEHWRSLGPDGCAFAIIVLLAAFSPLARRRTLALLGPPLAAILFVLGTSTLFRCAPLRDAVEHDAPLYSWLLTLVVPH